MIKAEILQRFQELNNFHKLLELLRQVGSDKDAASVYEMLPSRYDQEEQRQRNWFSDNGYYECALVRMRRAYGTSEELRLCIHPTATEGFDVVLMVSLQGDSVRFLAANRYTHPANKSH